MTIIHHHIEGVFELVPQVFNDERGLFFESFNQERWKQLTGLHDSFLQDNEAHSMMGVFRGMHYQIPPMAQAKLVRVSQGKALDIIVDIRENSDSYGEFVAVILDAEKKNQLYVPKGFAHGYLSLSEHTIFQYKCDQYYSREHEGGFRLELKLLSQWLDDPPAEVILSEKDQALPKFGQHIKFVFEN